MNDIDDIANNERWCRDQLAGIRATNPWALMPDERTAEHEPIIQRWRQTHAAYAELAGAQSTDSLEALKRALFIQWFEVAEPFFLTGILGLAPHSLTEVAGHIERALTDGGDPELDEMLAWYGRIADHAFDPSSTGPLMLAALHRPSDLAWLTSDKQRDTYPSRGSMGEYFLSLKSPAPPRSS